MTNPLATLSDRIDTQLTHTAWGQCSHPPAARRCYDTPDGSLMACERCGRIERSSWEWGRTRRVHSVRRQSPSSSPTVRRWRAIVLAAIVCCHRSA